MLKNALRVAASTFFLSYCGYAVAQVNSGDSPNLAFGMNGNSDNGCYTNAQAVYDRVSSELSEKGFYLISNPETEEFDFVLRLDVFALPIEETGQCVASLLFVTNRPITVDGMDGNFSVNTSNQLILGSGSNLNAAILRMASEYVAGVFSARN